MSVEIETPTDTVGAVMGDINARRGRIVSVNADDHAEQINALVPLAELLKYAPVLNALTGGRAAMRWSLRATKKSPGNWQRKSVRRTRLNGMLWLRTEADQSVDLRTT
ncbi:MAG: hypothetical protein ABL970_03635 [Nitrospira sp.]